MNNPGAMPLKDAAVRLASTSCQAFHTSESSGTEGLYVSKFKFPSLEAMHKFEGAWTDFNQSLRDDLITAAVARDPSLEEVAARPGGATIVGTNELQRVAAALDAPIEDCEPEPTPEASEAVAEALETMAASEPISVRVRVPEEAANYMNLVSTLCGEDRDTVASVMFAMASLRPGFMEKGSLPTAAAS